MNIEELKEKFREHALKYNMEEIAISRKFYHSYRVMDFCMLLAKYNDFSSEDMKIAMLVGLLHDYSRFEQWTNYKTYSDLKSIDHGDLAVKRLFDDNEIINFCLEEKYYDEIYDAIKYHNKYSYPEHLSDHNKLLCKVVRDADKLDIFYLLGINKDLIKEDDNLISDKGLKEKLADTALALLANHKFISLEKDLKHLVVEFGYLFMPKERDHVSTLMKITTQKKLFQPSKVFYLGTQDGKLLLLNENFGEDMFRKVSQDMLIRHKVDMTTINRSEYIMELY